MTLIAFTFGQERDCSVRNGVTPTSTSGRAREHSCGSDDDVDDDDDDGGGGGGGDDWRAKLPA